MKNSKRQYFEWVSVWKFRKIFLLFHYILPLSTFSYTFRFLNVQMYLWIKEHLSHVGIPWDTFPCKISMSCVIEYSSIRIRTPSQQHVQYVPNVSVLPKSMHGRNFSESTADTVEQLKPNWNCKPQITKKMWNWCSNLYQGEFRASARWGSKMNFY